MSKINKALMRAKESPADRERRASESREINRMRDKFENPKKYERSSIAHLLNENTGRYDIKSTPQQRRLKH